MSDHKESMDDSITTELTKNDATEGINSIDSIPMDERKRFFIKIIMIIRQNFREYFGLKFANQCGHFVDNYMCKEIHQFADWLEYPTGNHKLERDGSPWCAAISCDGCYLFVGYADKCIVKWDLLSLEQIDEWTAHEDAVACLIFRRGLLISGSDDRTVKVWNGYTNQLIHTLEGHTNWVTSVDLNRNGSQIISGCVDHSMRLWSVNTGKCLREINVHSDGIRSALFIDDLLISGSKDHSIKIVNPSNGTEVRSIREGITDEVWTVCMNSDESKVACLFNNGFSVYTWPEMEIILTTDMCSARGDFHPIYPDLLAVDDDFNCIGIYNVKKGDLICVLEGHTAVLRSICFSPDGRRIVSTSKDSSTQVWDVPETELVQYT